MTAISTVKAQDTLRVESLRTIDVCSGSKRWLVSASLGTVRFSDSLESFDITIGYDRNVLRPTDVLKEGTLSGQMSNGPTMNIVVPGELRIFGFNVARSVAGSVPLVAIAGDFTGSCEESSLLSVPYPPDFNSEFKKKVDVYVADEVKSIAQPKLISGAGCHFDTDSLIFSPVIEKLTLRVELDPYQGGERQKVLELRPTSQSDTNGYQISGVKATNNCTVDSLLFSESSTRTFVTVDEVNKPATVEVTVERRALVETFKSRIVGTVQDQSACSCVKPALSDTVVLKIDPVVSTLTSSIDEHNCTVSVRNGTIIGKCDHERMKRLEVFDLLGRGLREESESKSTSVEVSSDNLPNGIFIVRMLCGSNQTVKTIVK